MKKCFTTCAQLKRMLLLTIPYNPIKDSIRKVLIIVSNILDFIFLPYMIYKLISVNRANAIVCILPLALNIVCGIVYLAAPTKCVVKNKAIGVITIASHIVSQYLVEMYGVGRYFPPSSILAYSLIDLIAMNLFFIEHMMIISISLVATLIAEYVRIITYEANDNYITVLIQSTFTYVAYYVLTYILVRERDLIFKLKAQLKIENQIFMQSMDLCPVGFALFKDNQISFINEECKNILKFSNISEFHTTIDSLVPNTTEISHNNSSIQHRSIDIETNTIDWKIKHVNYEGQNIVMHTFMDMTYIKKHIAEIQAKATEMLVATSTHELRSPLNCIKSCFIYLQNQMLNKNCKDIIDRGVCSCDYQEDLINDIMDFAKIQENKIKCNNTHFPLKKLIQKCYDVMELPIKDKGLQFQLEYQNKCSLDSDLDMYSDERRIKQILLNFISNAIKFTTHGCIKICTKITEQACQISVKDTGTGIKNEDIPKLCKEFGILSDTANKNTSGTGLGLYLCKKLVAMLGGEVKIKSRYGIGSKFSIVLPISLIIAKSKNDGGNTNTELIQSSIRSIQTQDSHMLVLFVDDSAINISITKQMVESLGINVISALCGSDAVKLVIKYGNQIKIAFIDLHMPQMDGYELADKIRELWKSEGFKKFPLIALTGDDTNDISDNCKAHGFVDVLTKPISKVKFDELLCPYR